jgi:hypothetical protein
MYRDLQFGFVPFFGDNDNTIQARRQQPAGFFRGRHFSLGGEATK